MRTKENMPHYDSVGQLVMATETEWAIGCDVGQARDFCATIVLEARYEPISLEDGAKHGRMVRELAESKFHLRLAKRMKLGTAYDEMLLALKNLRQGFTQLREAELVIDMTGNRPLKRMAEQMGVHLTPVQITPGSDAHSKYDPATGFRNISKANLMNRLQSKSTCGDLILPQRGTNADADALRDEIANFAMSISASGNPSWNAASGHDDFITAAALALWSLAGETGNRVRVQQLLL